MALGRSGDGNWACAKHFCLRFTCSDILVHVCVYISIVVNIEHVHVMHTIQYRSIKS